VIRPHVIGFRQGQRVRSKLPYSSKRRPWEGVITDVIVPAEGARYARIITDEGLAFTELCRYLEAA
jgi:hypothetical protein